MDRSQSRHMAAAALIALALASAPPLAAQVSSPNPAAIVADPSRPDQDRAQDASRHPAELLAFLKIKPGQTVADVWPGDYWDRLFADAVGPPGKVYAVHLIEADQGEHHATPAAGSMPLPD